MGTLIDLHERDTADSDAAPAAHLDGQYLADEPLLSYVGEDERVAFVIVNKRGGVTIDSGGDSETYKPGRNYRTLVAVTDVRMLVVVGGAGEDGDRVVSVPLSTITGVDTDSGFLGNSLVVTTDAGEQWSIPCRDDLDPVRSYLTRAKRAWSTVERLRTEVEDRIATADDHLDDGDFEAALETAGEAISVIAHAREELDAVEMGRGVLANADFERREASIRTVQRRAHAGIAAEHQGRARQHRDDERYRDAHEYFERALTSHERAQAIDADDPDDDELADRRTEINRELTRLERTPAAVAADELDAARQLEDPVERAQALEDALDRHRDLLGLCWGPDAAFQGSPDRIRDRIVEIVEEVVAARIDAARQSLVAADRLTVQDRPEDARSECDRAVEQLEAARDVATELLPDRLETIDTWAATIADQRARIDERETATNEVVAGITTADDTGTTGTGDTGAVSADEIGAMGADETGAVSTGESAEIPTTGTADDADAAPDGDSTEPASTEERLATLDQSAFTRLVADVCRALGWRTTAFTESIDQYDVMATRADPVELRMLVWAVHRPDGDLDTAAVDRCATDRANVDRADVAALVTTGSIPDSVRERASEHNVKLLDRDDLLALLERESLTDLVEDATG